MQPGERIGLIRKIAANLESYEDWAEINLILKQFNLRTYDEWDGDQKSYVIAMVEYGDDDQLDELHNFLLEEQGDARTEKSFTKSVEHCWSTSPVHIFISHSSKNKKDVVVLKECLLQQNVASFVAHEDIHPTEEWQKEILCALDTCHALIAWSTSDFESSAWAQQEMGIALAKNKPIISVRRGIDPVGFTAKQQGVPGNKPIEQIADEIVQILVDKPRIKNLMQQALLQSLKMSCTFKQSRDTMSLLEKFDRWDAGNLQQLKECLKSNGQVRKSWGVPVRIEALLKKFGPQEDEIRIEDLPF